MDNNLRIEEIKKKLRQDNNTRRLIKKCLILARENEERELVELFLALLENFILEDGILENALYLAIENGHTEIVKLLLKAGADIHANDDYALHWAVADGHTEIVELLLKAGANVHAKDDEALRKAARNGHMDVAKILLKAEEKNL